MAASLVLRYEFSRDDDFGWLTAALATAKVSASTGFWVQWQDVEDWAAELAALPMRDGARSEATWGQSESDGSDYQPIVKAVISADRRGRLEALVHLGNHTDARVHCQAVFETDFPALQLFAEQLGRMMRRDGDEEATLNGADVD